MFHASISSSFFPSSLFVLVLQIRSHNRGLWLLFKYNVNAQVCGLFCSMFMILCGFIQATALNLGVLPMIVHPAPRFVIAFICDIVIFC